MTNDLVTIEIVIHRTIGADSIKEWAAHLQACGLVFDARQALGEAAKVYCGSIHVLSHGGGQTEYQVASVEFKPLSDGARKALDKVRESG